MYSSVTKKKSIRQIIPRSNHAISRKNIDENALKVLYRLKNAGFSSYLVGGCIRDLLLNASPKDFDIVTNAKPSEIKKIFANCRLIGRRFRLAHIVFGQEIIEVATFRMEAPAKFYNRNKNHKNGMLVRDNFYGSIDDDAKRRDFTINSLYYNIQDFSIVDYFNGLEDLQNRLIKIIGNPGIRYREDPVRMIRALRFAAKLDFKIEPKTYKAILKGHTLLHQVSPARLFEEFNKLFLTGVSVQVSKLLLDSKIWDIMFNGCEYSELVKLVLSDTDKRYANNKFIASGFVLSAIYWQKLELELERIKDINNFADSLNIATEQILAYHQKTIAIPKVISFQIKGIWELQYKLCGKLSSSKVSKILKHPQFKAALDFMNLRASQGDTKLEKIVTRWNKILLKNQDMNDKT